MASAAEDNTINSLKQNAKVAAKDLKFERGTGAAFAPEQQAIYRRSTIHVG